MKTSESIRELLLHGFVLVIIVLLGVLSTIGSGGGDSGDDTGQRHPCDDNWGVSIQEPTYDISYSVSTDSLYIYGATWVDKHWYDCFPCVPVLSVVKVIVTNETTGEISEAYDWLRLTIVGYIHYWNDNIALDPGTNNINVRLYYNNTEDGYDCIAVNYVPDSVPPSIPTGVATNVLSPSEIELNWDASTDNATTDDASVRYKLYRDGMYVKTASTTYATDSGLNPGTQYCYTITAIDTANNESPQSNPACATTLDQAEPTIPTDLVTRITLSGNIELEWEPSTDDVSVVGYKINRDGVYLFNASTTNFTDTTVAPDTRYCYTVYAYDQAANESGFSNESCSDTTWSITMLDNSSPNIGRHNAIAVDSVGAIHIAYYDDPDENLKYITNKSGSWVSATVDEVGEVGLFPDIVLDSNDSAHIVYYDQGEWFGGSYTWHDDLKYTNNLGGDWNISIKVADGGWKNSLTIDLQDFLHVSHISNMYGFDGQRYASNKTGSWANEIIAPKMSWSGIGVDATGGVHISAYYGYPENSLIYLYDKAGIWYSESVDTTDALDYNDIVLDTNGKSHISYCDTSGLSYVTNASGTWLKESLYFSDTYPRCNHNSLVIDSNGKIHISYINSIGYLFYVTNKSGPWLLTSLDKVGSVGSQTSIALDADDHVHISYHGVDEVLKYITNK